MEGTPFGRYRLVEVLGRGGMGEVWRAYDTTMNRVVALKLLPANLADDDQYQVRFRREAHAAAGLDEPHVVPIHDFGEIDGRLYVTMRLIDGKTIDELLAGGPLPPARAVAIVEQIAAALNAAHRIGLVHRDVKPSNVLVTEDDFAYLIDFGIARAEGATKLTSTGMTVGTLAYMAPERFTTDRADSRADTYALTCVLHECLTGSPPFPGDSVERQITGHLTMPPPRPSTMQPGVSPRMDDVIATGMAKKPDQRYATTKELAAAARAALVSPSPHDQIPVGSPPPPPNPSVPQLYPSTAPYVPPGGPPAAAAPWLPPPVTSWQPAGSDPPWWRGPAILIPIGLLVVVAVVIVGIVVIVDRLGGKADTLSSATANSRPSTTSATSAPARTIASAPGTDSSTPAPTTSAGPTRLQTADGLDGLLASMRAKFGDTMGYRLVVYPDYAIVDRADPERTHVKQGYMYKAGEWKSWAPAMTTTPFDQLADLGAVNVAAVTTTLSGAPSALGAPDGSPTYLIVDGAEGGGLELAIHCSAPGAGYMQVNADRTVKKIYPP